jgi:hypothetical protein
MKRFPFPSAILALSVWGASTAQAGVTIPNAPVLTAYPVTVVGDLGFSDAEYSAMLSSPGTASIVPPVLVFGDGFDGDGCTPIPMTPNSSCDLGTGTISATLGHDPSISLIATPANGAVGDAGGSLLKLVYYVEDVSLTQAAGTTTSVTVKDSALLSTSGDGAADDMMEVYGGSLGVVYNACASEGSSSNVAVCASGTSAFGNKTINFTYNQVYTVVLQIVADASGPVMASIDPTFVQSGGDGQFEFSPGVTAGVPEPATWAMLLVGLFGLGAAMRTRRPIGSAAR